jgi:hypothetical protein
LGAGCWDINLLPYFPNAGISSMCIDGSYVYTCSYNSGIISKFDITNGSNIWSQSYPTNNSYKVRQYGSYIYTCGLSTDSWTPIIDQIDKSDGSIFYTFEVALDYSEVTAMDIDSTGIYISLWYETDRIIYKCLDFSWSEIWSTPVVPSVSFIDIKTETLKVGSADVIAVGYERAYIDPDTFTKGRFDTINKTTGSISDTKFWPTTTEHCKMKGIDSQESDIFIGGYKTVPIEDPNYNIDNSRWVMTRGNPTIT